ncbi:patatin-like phospholipase family protein [Spirilliplanes yamanashiensis]|uniref:Patatin n=1 Tax=Spirilliplanes yamanashiensis TaxID=42233 RepID=A0A8J4DMJ7_9ACTN|nr:patatin-like phospholipase family protein [Spirilliplanes yamanashiensis]MDP9815209.1 NTE family protein [Spirilliplanes yamanashiensis]GIJ06523.1 patatin [Spirilliplanes yamanashiensis]
MAEQGGRALVLGGGGVTGVAWEIGLLHGLAEHGVDLTGADTLIGTSAGSVVAAQIGSGTPLPEMFAQQTEPPAAERRAEIGAAVLARFVIASAIPGPRHRGRAWLGRAALRAKTVPESERRAVIAHRVPQQRWPDRRLLVTAVDAGSGEPVVFDRDSGVPLTDAVGASCAVPIVWPPVTIGDRRYLDGGMRTVANVDLAAGADRVVVIAPLSRALRRSDRPQAQAAALGVPSIVLTPDPPALAAIGRNVLDPANRVASAHAGRAQAARVADRVRMIWTPPAA